MERAGVPTRTISYPSEYYASNYSAVGPVMDGGVAAVKAATCDSNAAIRDVIADGSRSSKSLRHGAFAIDAHH